MSEPLANPQRVRILAGSDTDSLGDRPAMNRQTSVYTIHLPHLGAADLLSVAERFPQVQDQGEKSISFRARSDAEAKSLAKHAAHGVSLWNLTTGLGIHKRDVL